MSTPWLKSIILFLTILSVVVTTFVFAVLHHDDGSNKVQYTLVSHEGKNVSEKDFVGQYQLVFFGFTHCAFICPNQMSKLTQVMEQLDASGKAHKVTPIFISVDPERDSPEKVHMYLQSFHKQFVGLTGTRVALKSAANSFKTLLAEAPKNPEKDYQITHSSTVYLVDPLGKLVNFFSLDDGVESVAKELKAILL